jgi:hypothetical protein
VGFRFDYYFARSNQNAGAHVATALVNLRGIFCACQGCDMYWHICEPLHRPWRLVLCRYGYETPTFPIYHRPQLYSTFATPLLQPMPTQFLHKSSLQGVATHSGDFGERGSPAQYNKRP